MTKKPKILICGASIAGPCAAFWLAKAGCDVTVVERSAKFRDGGQNIDITDAGREVVELMGLLTAIKAKTTGEDGLRFVDRDGRTLAEFATGRSASFTREIEILRGDLSRIFFEASRDQVEYRFGVAVKILKDNGSSVTISFTDGATEEFDLVICAEGTSSPTRKLVMNEFVDIKYLGLWIAYFRIPKIPTDTNWARWYNADNGRAILLRPATKESESVSVDFRRAGGNFEHLKIEQQRQRIADILQGAGGESERIVANLHYDDDLYYGPLSQVKASRWSVGRFVLVGDAAYGPSPVTGKGTTLAIIGAYVLAGEITKGASLSEALSSYETKLRPYIEKCQQLPPGVPWIVHPTSRLGLRLLNTAIWLAGSRFAKSLFALKARKSKADKRQQFILPRYDWRSAQEPRPAPAQRLPSEP